MRVSVAPDKADTELVVHPNAVLPCSICAQTFQAISGWDLKVGNLHSILQVHQLAQNDAAEIRRNAPTDPRVPQSLCVRILKAGDHPGP